MYIGSIWPQMVVKHNRRTTCRCPLGELRDATLLGRSGQTMNLEGREPTINTPQHSHDIQIQFMRKSSSGWRRVAIGLEDMLHQQNVNWSGSHMQTSQTLRSTSPVSLITSRCFQAPLEISKVLSDSARVFSGAPKSTCCDGGAFRMLQDLTCRIVKFWSSWDHCTTLWESWCHILTAAVVMVP